MKGDKELLGQALAKRVILDMLSDPAHTSLIDDVAETYVESRAEFVACKREIRRILKVLHVALKRGEKRPTLVLNS